MSTYSKSKTLSEQAAWDFIKDHKPSFDLVCVNPGFVQGPLLSPIDCSSAEIIIWLTTGKVPAIPDISLPIVDVRDVAFAHLSALTTAEASGKRFILVSDGGAPVEFFTLGGWVKEALEPHGYKVTSRRLPSWVVRVGSWFDPTMKQMHEHLGDKFYLDTRASQNILGVKYISCKDAVLAMCATLNEFGVGKKAKK